MLTKYQKFRVERVKRSTINFAHYNPRKISEENRKRLTKNIKSDAGLIETIVLNKVTMNLVSGHQRLTILDKLEKYPSKDYEIDVAIVEMSEEQEKKQNVFMNSKEAQGDFDSEILSELMDGFDISDFGISETEVALMKSNPDTEKFSDEYFNELFTKKTGTKEDKAASKQNVKDMKKQINEKAGKNVSDTNLSYCVLNFKTFKEKQFFMARFDLDPFDTFINGNEFSEMVERIYD